MWYHAGLLHVLDPVLRDPAAPPSASGLPPHMDWKGNLQVGLGYSETAVQRCARM